MLIRLARLTSMGIRIDFRGKIRSYAFPARLEGELIALFEDNVDRVISRSRRSRNALSIKTQEYRLLNVCAAVRELRQEGGYAVESPWSIRNKHVQWLVESWVRKGQTAGTIENKLTYLRAMAEFMNKLYLVKTLAEYVDRTEHGLVRHYVAQEDKSWSGNGIDIDSKIAEIERTDEWVGIQLRLMWLFGLRVEESAKLQPGVAVRGGTLHVVRGTKGGRKREVLIDMPETQYPLLARAASLANPRTGSTTPADYTLDQWMSHFYEVLRKHGLVRKETGCTAHGLRHEYLQGLYQRNTGDAAPVKRGVRLASREVHEEGQRIVAEAAGHSRPTKSNAYLSTYAVQERLSKPVVKPGQAALALAAANGNKSHAALALGISRRSLYRLLDSYAAGDQS